MGDHASGLKVWPQFLEEWERLRQESELPGTTVVVEGDRDRDALRRLGLRGPIVLVHGGQSLSALAHALGKANRRVIVMTDWDLEGGQIAHRLERFFVDGGVAFDLEYRRRLALLLHGELTHVEGLFGWARRTAERSGGPLEHFVRPIDEA